MKKTNIKFWNSRNKEPTKINKMQLKASAVIGLILMIALLLTHLLPPLYITMAPGDYDNIAEGEWIAAGEDAGLTGRFFKIDATSYVSGYPASHFEVFPAGFPVSCCFVEDIWAGKMGVYSINIAWALIDFFVMWMIVLSTIVVFGYYTQNKKTSKKSSKKKMSVVNKFKLI